MQSELPRRRRKLLRQHNEPAPAWKLFEGRECERLRDIMDQAKDQLIGLVFGFAKRGSSSVVERQLPKLNVAGSIPVSRSNQSSQV